MRRHAHWLWAGIALMLPAAMSVPVFSDDLSAAQQALGGGQYEEALALLSSLVSEQPASAEVRRTYARALVSVGRYQEAQKVLAEFLERQPETSGLRVDLARAMLATGGIREARTVLEEELRRSGSQAIPAQFELGMILRRGGELEAASSRFYDVIDQYNRRGTLTGEDLLAIGHACRALGGDNPQLFKDALRAYDEALVADPDLVEARIALAELFLEKYEGTEARHEINLAFDTNPNHPQGRLAVARILRFEGSPAALSEARRSLAINPNHVAAHVFVAELLLELESYAEAEEEARTALAVDPTSLEALSVLAASHFLRGDSVAFDEVQTQVLERNPHYADFFNLIADACVRNRFYRQAADFARRAIDVDPRSWRGHGLLGLNLLRLSHIEEGRRYLELSFAGDPYNVWIKNTLDLVDTFVDFKTHRSEHFEFVAHERESDLLAPYALSLAEEAYGALAERYQMAAPAPIRLEFFESEADFSVRTIGLAGMGALGVCFGEVIAQDSPRARPRGTFNWGSTLWHEIVHSFTLAASDHRVPRWLTEGLSVYEERRARQGWGDDVNPRFLAAWRDEQLLPIGELNNGFVRPAFPEQIGLSYLQASYVCELIERDHGFEALLGMLHGYRDRKPTAELFDELMGVSLEEFDGHFQSYLEERFGGSLAALGEAEEEPREGDPTLEELETIAAERSGHFASQMEYAVALLRAEETEKAIPVLERAKQLFPEYVGHGSPYHLLAEIYTDRGEAERAAAELAGLLTLSENDYDARLALGDLRIELGDLEGAAEALEGGIYVYPYDSALYLSLADLYRQLGRSADLVRARSSIVALDPVDKAGAVFDLALALDELGDTASAKRETLRALEIAPTYVPAQQLLLRLHRGSAASREQDGRN